jgi:thermitase
MNQNVRRVISAVALTSLAASMVACQASLNPATGVAPRGNVNAANAGTSRAPQSANAAAIDAAAARGLSAVPGEFLVKLKPGATAQAAMAQSGTRSLGLQSKPLGSAQTGIVLMKAGGMGALSAGSDTQTLQALRSNPAVLYAEPNYIVKLNLPREAQAPVAPVLSKAAPNDPMYKDQYAHQRTESEAGWAIEQGNKDFILAIVDTGVDAKHPDLAAKLLTGYNAVDDVPNGGTDGNGHGTHCAGIAAAITNNGVGVAGYAPNVKILPVKVLSDSGSGSYAGVAAGIIWAADHGAKVISMSLGGPSNSKVVEDAVKYALSKDAMLIAASGNSGSGAAGNTAIPSYPAVIEGVMAVGATDNTDKLARFSQIGKWISVTAPGVNILSTFPTHATDMPGINYGSISGTSMATPAVAGLAALVRSKFPQLNAAQAEAHIEATADDKGDAGYDIKFGFGRINVAKAMSTTPGTAVRR